ncbi:PIR Superfamily Protein [Plasmodium ovale curtisi]|uniref:PIR Superfamily Protein n=1 Tax=Plasmodium ovale curtisi TaxID=864141 RepID=A0A1A8XAR2_PLAOA|nr:PIR Superfamily Protein [Plasmodium ovale curtisi]
MHSIELLSENFHNDMNTEHTDLSNYTKYDICILLNYWIYDKLTKIFGAKNTSDNINIAFGNLQYICSKLYYYPSNMAHRNKYKTSLYEYFEEQGSTEKNNCLDFYDKCKDYNSKTVLPNLLCHNDMVPPKTYAVAKAAKRNRPMNYTPVGSWIRKLGGHNQTGISDMNEFSSYTQESGDMFSNHAANYISYQPI